MTHSRIDIILPALARSANKLITRPVKGMRACKERLALEWRYNREGDCIEGPCVCLWIFRGRADASNALKVVEDAAQGVLLSNDRDVRGLCVLRMDGEGPPVEVQVFSWPEERQQWLAAIEAAT